ncbi:uncharacterized protein LOC134458521 [Engraulis encrasicolus]|uniref:uncharacterized protein LOC134458521 n=1 Tax=Engraulis encrasicolus TaxID=184585 RepID=UPI002FD383D2
MREPCRVCGVQLLGNQCRWLFGACGRRRLAVLLARALGLVELKRDGRGELLCAKCVFLLERVLQCDTEIRQVLDAQAARVQQLQAERDELCVRVRRKYLQNNPPEEEEDGEEEEEEEKKEEEVVEEEGDRRPASTTLVSSRRPSSTQPCSRRESSTQPASRRESSTQPASRRESSTQPASRRASSAKPFSRRESILKAESVQLEEPSCTQSEQEQSEQGNEEEEEAAQRQQEAVSQSQHLLRPPSIQEPEAMDTTTKEMIMVAKVFSRAKHPRAKCRGSLSKVRSPLPLRSNTMHPRLRGQSSEYSALVHQRKIQIQAKAAVSLSLAQRRCVSVQSFHSVPPDYTWNAPVGAGVVEGPSLLSDWLQLVRDTQPRPLPLVRISRIPVLSQRGRLVPGAKRRASRPITEQLFREMEEDFDDVYTPIVVAVPGIQREGNMWTETTRVCWCSLWLDLCFSCDSGECYKLHCEYFGYQCENARAH